MSYVKCLKNKAYIHVAGEPAPDYDLISLTIGQVYKLAPPEENDGDDWRVYDESGEDYLFPPDYFEPYEPNGDHEHASESVTAHLTPYMKNILHAEAIAADKSISALLRDLIAERFDLSEVA